MPRGDAVQSRPSLADEMGKFQGFSTNDGETVTSVADSKEEQAAQKQSLAADATAKAAAAAKPVKEMAADATGHASGQDEEKDDEISAETAENETQDSGQKPDDTTLITMAEVKKMMAKAASKRIGEIKRTGREALEAEKQRNDALEKRLLAALETKPLTGEVKEGKADPDTEPKATDFEYGELDARYIRALARFEARQEFKAGQDNQNKARQTDAAAREAQELGEKKATLEKAGTAKFEDFDEVVIQGAADGEWPLSVELGKLILGSEVGHMIAYHLASNPKEARQVFGKSPLEQAAYFGRQEAKYSSEEDAPKQEIRIPKAPAPLNGARGRGGKTPVSPDTSDFASFEALAMRRK
jgi:hypothetical protein